ncbi:bifunctional diaminohydroxyphosphoribosylaminopyrimidine deaminase/5-amino-6-(5-phosphoribosylamino)uracil reductase RibD [Maribellus maritimus]|uniref:bifunctional diaminohydroxyphosphoribosylaminopyrimidine deaminase/5-amino-6-(5-phosphoribosylamino)uracil reductase RibD n=1 Tax=Maribellus maritimus TaxID=2870838 RepID=UPI001EEBA144|nr:bifunctional diaminohydroxyphosphoribosylaminopyrimidine deaminase/5-amino-6-(5-phosphoribosylamino)uracil reductase RibD [Maribellus maritimus]MCG6187491.1 bifunctional diaminohydroxyphosphoribosylaminopyrimidine deaminase/5-amino-6-(5-phosphoribosylamino)uracil reductase RibD [Maribellus maritimus]
MNVNKKYMLRALELAQLGIGEVSPNPMVGCVIVCEGKIIGEGFHQKYGDAHAEVNAIHAVKDQELLPKSTLYVTLEPCAHFGLTPPCSDLIIRKRIPRVIIGTVDPFAEVAGKGIEKLKKAGVEVEVGVLEKECRNINKRFFTFHEKKRPYVILKWAQTQDGFIDIERSVENYGEPTWITGNLALRLVHKIRAEEGAILVGRKTAEKDNPSLTVRHWYGKNPLRAVVDNELKLPKTLNVFDQSEKTVVFNILQDKEDNKLTYVKLNNTQNPIQEILCQLYKENILSVIVEGGHRLLQSFILANLWDEAHIFTGNKFFSKGVKAPQINGKLIAAEQLDNDWLYILKNQD